MLTFHARRCFLLWSCMNVLTCHANPTRFSQLVLYAASFTPACVHFSVEATDVILKKGRPSLGFWPVVLPGEGLGFRGGWNTTPTHQQPEVNYLPRFGPQLISLEECSLRLHSPRGIDLLENLDIVHITLLVDTTPPKPVKSGV